MTDKILTFIKTLMAKKTNLYRPKLLFCSNYQVFQTYHGVY